MAELWFPLAAFYILNYFSLLLDLIITVTFNKVNFQLGSIEQETFPNLTYPL